MAIKIVIPARFSSTRFPKKLLADVAGKPLLLRTIESALSAGFDDLIVAVDDQRLAQVAIDAGVKTLMTSESHPSGTSRLAEVVEQLQLDPLDVVVNWQADEPLMPSENIHQVIESLNHFPTCDVATLCEAITTKDELFDSNAVKVVFNHQHQAMYFSRATIPWDRTHYPESHAENIHAYRHMGLYAYRANFLLQVPGMPASRLEDIECLEQLRWLDAGHKVRVDLAKASTPPGVDTPADLKLVLEAYTD